MTPWGLRKKRTPRSGGEKTPRDGKGKDYKG